MLSISHRSTTISGLVVSGLAFAAYPALRPYGPESGASGASDLGSGAWLAAHLLGMVGFVSLAFVLRSVADRPPWTWTGRPVRETETRMWLAVALLLPYYGAEAYGLNALGKYAVEQDAPAVLEVADLFRYAPVEVTTFAAGLVLLATVGGRIAHGLWRTGVVGRTGGLLAGLGLATYLPQFFGTPAVRVAHGVVLGVGLLLLAVATHRAAGTGAATSSPEALVVAA